MARPAPASTKNTAPNRKFRVWRPDSWEPLMLAPPAIRAPTSISAAAHVRALELSMLVSPANGSCANAGALARSTVPSKSPMTRVRVLRLPMRSLPFVRGRLQSGGPVRWTAAPRPSDCHGRETLVSLFSGLREDDLVFSNLKQGQRTPESREREPLIGCGAASPSLRGAG